MLLRYISMTQYILLWIYYTSTQQYFRVPIHILLRYSHVFGDLFITNLAGYILKLLSIVFHRLHLIQLV